MYLLQLLEHHLASLKAIRPLLMAVAMFASAIKSALEILPLVSAPVSHCVCL